MNIVIVGQGAIGLLLYSKLWLANHQVSLKTSKRQWQQTQYIQLSELTGYNRAIPFCYATNQQLAQAELIIVCTKAYDTANAVNTIKQYIPPKTPIVLAHNGLGVLEELAPQIVDQYPLLALITTHGAMKPSSRHVIHTGRGDSQLGLLNNQVINNEQLVRLFNQAHINTLWHQNINVAQWQKLAINCVINPITALYNIDNGDCLKPKYQPLIHQLIDEFIAIASNQNFSFEHKQLYKTISLVAKNTAKNCSSMRADFIHQRRSELNYITGFLTRVAKQQEIDAPNHLKLLLQLQKKLR